MYRARLNRRSWGSLSSFFTAQMRGNWEKPLFLKNLGRSGVHPAYPSGTPGVAASRLFRKLLNVRKSTPGDTSLLSLCDPSLFYLDYFAFAAQNRPSFSPFLNLFCPPAGAGRK